MKLPAFLNKGTLFDKLCPLFTLLTLLEGLLMYMAVALQPLVLIVLLVLAMGSALLFVAKGEQSKKARVIARIGLLAPPALALLLLVVYYISLIALQYTVSVTELGVLTTILLESTLLFATPALAVLALQGKKLDAILSRVAVVLNLVLACFTVFCTANLQNIYGDYLLFTLIKHPVFDALFLVTAAAAVIVSFEPLYDKVRNRK